jgi:membrane-bound lytic murein transglycosylase A
MKVRVPIGSLVLLRRLGIGAAAAVLAACASNPQAPADEDCNCGSSAPASAKAAAAASAPAAAGKAAASAAPPAETGAADQPQPFETRYARFEPVAFADVPGWKDDPLHEGLAAFRQSCTALRKKPVWGELCERSDALDTAQPLAWRTFFENNFRAWSVQQLDRTPDGLITGYYEPLLNGSRNPSPRFAYPVYGTPSDLLFVEAKSLTGSGRQWFRNDDRLLIPAVPGAKGAREYLVQLGDTEPGIRDKKYRVRVDESGTPAIVPYWSRQEIEKRELRAPVFAWVDDPYALYSLQVQGSGKIKLTSGEVVRVGYGEQNGYPFLPRGKPEDAVLVASAAKTRGLQIASSSVSTATAAPAGASVTAQDTAQNAEVADIIAKLKGKSSPAARTVSGAPAASAPRPAKPAASATASTSNNAGVSPEVAAMIAALKKPGSAAPATASVASTSAASMPAAANAAATATFDADTASLPAAAAPRLSQLTDIPDPSYVFFRRIPDGPQGPLGALGVSLTAGRSIAVDPRTTPLGYPVFLSTVADDGSQKQGRLMFAQDTGGAIRGPVRADFFWGFGPRAGSQAAAMKDAGRMWLLLPKDLQIAAADPVRTRGVGGAVRVAECVVADADNCVEE